MPGLCTKRHWIKQLRTGTGRAVQIRQQRVCIWNQANTVQKLMIYKKNGRKKMEEKTANMAENIRVTFTGFHYIKDGDYPNDFEVCLLILKDNSLSAGCWDTGLYATEGGKQPGAFRQARGCFIDADYVKA